MLVDVMWGDNYWSSPPIGIIFGTCDIMPVLVVESALCNMCSPTCIGSAGLCDVLLVDVMNKDIYRYHASIHIIVATFVAPAYSILDLMSRLKELSPQTVSGLRNFKTLSS